MSMYKPKDINIKKWQDYLKSLERNHPIELALSKQKTKKNGR